MLKNTDYIQMSEDVKRKNSDDFFEELAQRYMEASDFDIIDRLNRIIQAKESLMSIKVFLLDKENKRIGNLDNRYIECLRALEIAELEDFLGISTIFSKAESVDELVDIIQKVRFYLRRIEFGWDYIEWKEIADFIEEYGISFVCLCKICCEKAFRNPAYIVEELANMYVNIGKANESILIKTFYESIQKT